MSNPIALAVLAGVASAALFLSLSFGLPGTVLLSYFVQLPLLLVGLTLGLTPALIATVGAGAVSGLIAGGLAALTFAVIVGLPALVLVRQALLNRTGADGSTIEWYPPGPLLAQMTALAAAALLIAFLMFAGEEGGLVGAVEGFLAEALIELGAAGPGTELAGVVRGSAALFPGIMAASWLLMVAINAMLAQSLAVRLRRNIRPTPDIAQLALPRWLMYGTAAAALLSLAGDGALGFLGRSLLVLFLVPYLFQGLAVAHAFARHWGLPQLALVAFYVVLVLLGWPALLIVVLGLVEDWAQLRRRAT